MTDIQDFIGSIDEEERTAAFGRMLNAGAMVNLDEAIIATLEALSDGGEYTGTDYMIDPYAVLDGVNTLFRGLDMNPLESEAYKILQDCCDCMEIEDEGKP
mgnify:FL=1